MSNQQDMGHASGPRAHEQSPQEAVSAVPVSPAIATTWKWPGTIESQFEDWWRLAGQYLDPDTSDVPWFDKRKGLAALAFAAAMAQSRNYIADEAVYPLEFRFANGRIVRAAESDSDIFLTIGIAQEIEVAAASETPLGGSTSGESAVAESDAPDLPVAEGL